jgi:DNA-binding transcriptional regulator YhcF (GntR family)
MNKLFIRFSCKKAMDIEENKALRTSADDMVEIIKRHKKMSVDDLAKMLRISAQSVQAMVDFLVEEKVLDIEYKFTTPYVYLNEGKPSAHQGAPGAFSKEEFFNKAREKGVTEDEIIMLWKRYLASNLPQIRQDFMTKAYAKGASAEKAEELWQKYLAYL